MGKYSSNRHKAKDTAPRKSGHGAADPGTSSLATFRAERALDALTPAFVRWFDDGSPGAATVAVDCLRQVKAVLGRYMGRTAAAGVTVLDPVPLALAITDVLVATATAEDEDAVLVVEAVHAYVDFLSETGRWSGSAEQLAGITDFFESVGSAEDEPGIIDVPDIAEEQALEVFSGLPLIQRATALLQWIGEGKPVTATGALRVRDIEAAAACVGVTVRGAAKRADSAPAGPDGPADPVPTVRSMYEVALLAQVWNALEAAELIQIKSTKVLPSPESGGFLTGRTSERLAEFSFFTTCFLEHAVLGFDPEQPWQRPVAGLQVSVLIAAATADPPLVERVLAAADHAPEAEKRMADLLARTAVAGLEALAELGLLGIDTHFRVPPALVGCVADVFDHDYVLAYLGLDQAPDDADVEEPAGKTRPGRRQAPVSGRKTQPPAEVQPSAEAGPPAEARPDAAPVLQLKIMLKGARPPIWRRVLVPAGIPLSQLHRVIQGLFGWLDYHLHHFQTGGFRGPTYAPVDPGNDFYGERSLDESKVTVGELLTAVGSKLSYTYDFGDDWEHSVTLEKVLADDGGGRLPRCTAGRGAAPAEDSGGTWGWANIVQAVNDPDHEEHEEYRQWLGLQPGETLDAKAFDVDQANEDLAGLL